jgi:hypothetical protein
MATQTFTTSGTFDKPAGVTSITVQCWGGGGAGGAGGNTGGTNYGGGGGKGGQYASKTITYPFTAQSISYTVALSSLVNGNDTIWDSTQVIARGGASGSAATSVAPGAGATTQIGTGVGDTIFNGGNGASGTTNVSSGGGGGGAGSTGAGGNASGATAGTGTTLNGGNGGAGVSAAVVGNPGNTYGGGGSGGRRGGNAGGRGAAGLIIITYNQPNTTQFIHWIDDEY